MYKEDQLNSKLEIVEETKIFLKKRRTLKTKRGRTEYVEQKNLRHLIREE